MNSTTRVLVAAVLVGLVFVMGVHYSAQYEKHWPYPGTDDLAENYEQYVDTQALLFGTVTEVNENTNTARIRVEHSTGAFTMTVRKFDVDVRLGGVVQVLGTLQPGYTIAAENVEVVNPAGSSKLYKWGVSLVGALLIVVLFFHYWRIDVETLSFEVR